MSVKDGGEALPLPGPHLFQALEFHRGSRKSPLDEFDDMRVHAVAMLGEELTEARGQKHLPIARPRVVDLTAPVQLNFLDARTRASKSIGGSTNLIGDLGIDAVVAKIDAQRQPQSAHPARHGNPDP